MELLQDPTRNESIAFTEAERKNLEDIRVRS